MAEAGELPPIIPEIALRNNDGALTTLVESGQFMDNLIGQLELNPGLARLQELRMSYTTPFEQVLAKYPKQSAALVALVQPGGDNIGSGYLHPETHMLVGQRGATSSWGANTWSVPMGKIEAQDGASDQSLGEIVSAAAHRESIEEMSVEALRGYYLITGSFLDLDSGVVVHAVCYQIGGSGTGEKSAYITTKSTREHSQVGWIKMKDFTQLSPRMPGTDFVLLTSLKYLRKGNAVNQQNPRYKE